LEKITQLISTLTTREVNAIRKFYRLRPQADANQRFRLFEKVLNDPELSDMEAASFLQKNVGDSAFSMVKRRLKDDIIKVLVWEQRHSKFRSKYFKSRFECRLLIAEAEILSTRGANLLAIEHLYKAKRLAEQFELTNELVIINEQLIPLVATREGLQTYSRIAQESLGQFKLIQDKFKAQDYLRQLTIPNLFQANKEFNYKIQAEEASRELRKLSEETSSVEIRFWYLRSEVFYNHLRKDYTSAFQFAQDFLELVKTSPVVYSIDNMGGANMQLGMISIYRGEYESAALFANTAREYFTKGSVNFVNASDALFLSFFYRGLYDEAIVLLDEMKKNRNITRNHMLRSKWNFYDAQLHFRMGKYAESLSILQQQTDLFSDKSGWRIGIKILEMMCIVELGNDDWLDFRIETFRKLLSDLRKENIFRPKLIHQLFRFYIKSGYDWKNAIRLSGKHLTLLQEGTGENSWDPLGYEMTRFDSWLSGRLNGSSRSV